MGHVADPSKPKDRSVEKLTRAQLKNKRDRDRIAQRISRARHRDYINTLQEDLHKFQDENRKLQDENKALQALNQAYQEEIYRLQQLYTTDASSWPVHTNVIFSLGTPRSLNDHGHSGQLTSNPVSWSSPPTAAVSNIMSSGVPADGYRMPLDPVPAAMIQPGSPPYHDVGSMGMGNTQRQEAGTGAADGLAKHYTTGSTGSAMNARVESHMCDQDGILTAGRPFQDSGPRA